MRVALFPELRTGFLGVRVLQSCRLFWHTDVCDGVGVVSVAVGCILPTLYFLVLGI